MQASAYATTSDGHRLGLTHYAAAGPRRGVVLMSHAMMANASYLRTLATTFAAAGLDCYALDFRGHGHSTPPTARTGNWCFDDYVRHDLPAAWQAVAKLAKVDPGDIAYLGHSLGGLVGLAAFGQRLLPAPRQLILVGSNMWTRTEGLWEKMIVRVFDGSTRLLGYAPIRLLGYGSDDESRGYVRQFCDWAYTGKWTSRDGVDYTQGLGNITAPTLVVSAEGDRLCRPHRAKRLADHLGGDVSFRIVGRVHGDAAESNHFGFFKDSRLADTLWNELAERLTER